MFGYDIIKKKRDGYELSSEEINFFVQGVVQRTIADYQASAMLMAIYLRGMSTRETVDLTLAIRDSGAKIDLKDIEGVTVDKHSSGGVGDKTTLVVAPIVAACGVKVAKMSGRGLGHTGGTIDKLETIPGVSTTLDGTRFVDIVNNTGVCIAGQSANLAPADKILYALRDVTATVDSLPLIVSSIMGKKLALGTDGIVLDVKTGSGSFMKTPQQSRVLAREMVNIGNSAGRRTMAIISNMDMPLGNAVGNALEVVEAIDTLRGHGPEDFTSLCLTLASAMLYVAGMGERQYCYSMAGRALSDGSALRTFRNMVAAQGGDVAYVDNVSLFGQAPYKREVLSPYTGYIEGVNAEAYGHAAMLLGAGRATKHDAIDPLAGVVLHCKTSQAVLAGQPIATLYTSKPLSLDEAQRCILEATRFCALRPPAPVLVLDEIE